MYLPGAVLTLPIAFPSYDMRNPNRGHATFRPIASAGLISDATPQRASFSLTDVEPAYYRDQFVCRWNGMRDSKGGRLLASTQWQLDLCAGSNAVLLSSPFVEANVFDEEDARRLSFDWKAMVSSFLG